MYRPGIDLSPGKEAQSGSYWPVDKQNYEMRNGSHLTPHERGLKKEALCC